MREGQRWKNGDDGSRKTIGYKALFLKGIMAFSPSSPFLLLFLLLLLLLFFFFFPFHTLYTLVS
jgi:hypothetical protein